jgi:CRP/FNR family transcriptional regulator
LALRSASARDREFDFIRQRALRDRARTELGRVARYLIAIAALHAHEGGNGSTIPEDVTSGFVAERLGLSLDMLAASLLELKKRNLVHAVANGLRVIDLKGLEQLADAH